MDVPHLRDQTVYGPPLDTQCATLDGPANATATARHLAQRGGPMPKLATHIVGYALSEQR